MPSRLPGSPRPWLLPTPAGRAGRRLGTGVGWRVQASAVAAGSALSSSLKAASSWEASVCARRIFGPRSHPARPGLGGRGAVSIRVPSRCSGGGAEGTRRSLFLGWGASRFHRGTPAGTALGGRGRPPAVRYWPSRLLGGLDCGRGPSSGEGQWGLGASRPAGGRGQSRAPPTGRALCGPPRPPSCHRPLPRPPAPRSCKGISTFFARLLRRSPCTPKLSQARLLQAPSVRVRDTGGPGSWRSVPVPSLPPPPFVHRGRATRSQPSGPGAGPRPSFLSSPRQSQAARGRERAPRSPRQVREGCVHSFSCGEQVAPGSGPFCSLYFILKLYLMLLYERGRGGKRAVRHLYVQMSYLLCVYQR